jgi:hypothetical protein
MSKDSDILDTISLTHGQARWVVKHFNMLSGESEAKFDAFIKSLRRDGVPFADEEKGVGAGFNLKYRYENLMELALALTLRTQGIVARDMIKLIATHRSKLRSFFRTAYLDRGANGAEIEGLYLGLMASVDNYGKKLSEFSLPATDYEKRKPEASNFVHLSNISGWYLDLSLVYSPSGNMTMFNFDLVKASKAVTAYIAGHTNLYPRPPIPLTDIAVDIVRLAQGAPKIKRGRKP